MTRDRLAGLDALRGIAALMVAGVCHAGNLIGPWRYRPVYDMPGIGDLIQHSDVAVDLFFVLSGFVFTHVYSRSASCLVSCLRVRAIPFIKSRLPCCGIIGLCDHLENVVSSVVSCFA